MYKKQYIDSIISISFCFLYWYNVPYLTHYRTHIFFITWYHSFSICLFMHLLLKINKSMYHNYICQHFPYISYRYPNVTKLSHVWIKYCNCRYLFICYSIFIGKTAYLYLLPHIIYYIDIEYIFILLSSTVHFPSVLFYSVLFCIFIFIVIVYTIFLTVYNNVQV